MKKKKFANGGPSYENNIRDGGTSFIDEFEKSKAKVKTDEEKPRFETKEGKNPNISDETREKAKKFVESGGKEESKPAPKATLAPKAMPKPAAKAEPKDTPALPLSAEEKARMEKIGKKQALENVSPEDYVTPGGILKAGLKAITNRGLKTMSREAFEAAAPKLTGPKPTSTLSLPAPIDKNAAIIKARADRAAMRNESMRQQNQDAGPAGRARATGAPYDYVPAAGDLRPDFKSGGKVKSASSRADGCAIRGKTRA